MHRFFCIHFNKHKYIISFVISCYVWSCYFLIALCYCTLSINYFTDLFSLLIFYLFHIQQTNSMHVPLWVGTPSYPGMQTQQTDFSWDDNLSDWICVCAVQVLFKLARLEELPCSQVRFKALSWYKVVLPAVDLMCAGGSCGVCNTFKNTSKYNTKQQTVYK